MNDASTIRHPAEGQAPRTFGDHMRLWRRLRGVSQLQLAMRADVSSRHVSFLESGRSNPSRQMIATLADALDVPLRARNEMMLAAGFAPAFSETPIAAPDAAYLRRVLETVLKGYEPWPAFVLDRNWDLVMVNAPARLLTGPEGHGNLLEMTLADGPVRQMIVNWDEVAAETLRRLRREAEHAGDATLLRKAEALMPKGWRAPPLPPGGMGDGAAPLLIPVHMRLGETEMKFITAITSLGTAADVGVQELVIECFLPADGATEETLRALAG